MFSTLDRALFVLAGALAWFLARYAVRKMVRGQTRTAIPLAVGISLSMSVRCVAGDFAGCYELQLTQWSPAISLGGDMIFISPPSRVALTTTPDHTWDAHGFGVTPAGGVNPSVHKDSYWTSDAHHVHIVWTTGFSGLTMDLEERGSDLIGTAHTFWDFPRPQQTSHVVATRISCESKKSRMGS
jgi:hypothetical protein